MATSPINPQTCFMKSANNNEGKLCKTRIKLLCRALLLLVLLILYCSVEYMINLSVIIQGDHFFSISHPFDKVVII